MREHPGNTHVAYEPSPNQNPSFACRSEKLTCVTRVVVRTTMIVLLATLACAISSPVSASGSDGEVPDTDLGGSVSDCAAQLGVPSDVNIDFYDEGHSVNIAELADGLMACLFDTFGIPGWVTEVPLGHSESIISPILDFGDIAVVQRGGQFLLLDSEVTPND